MAWIEGLFNRHPLILYLAEHVWDEGLAWMSGVCLIVVMIILLA